VANYFSTIDKELGSLKLLNDALNELTKRIQEVQVQASKLDPRGIEGALKSLEDAADQVNACLKRLEEVREHAKGLLSKLPIQALAEYEKGLTDMQESLRSVISSLEKIRGR
jgi:uncharacterized phage infection (PIP) family protein YhgE